jgi:type I restriction enzyme S subunit
VRCGDQLEPLYLLQCVRGGAFQNLVRLKKAGLGVPHLFQADLREFEIGLPPLPEQRQIAAILDTIDDAIRKTEQIVAKLKHVKRGLLHDLLTRGIDENGELRDPERHPEQFKDSPLGRIPREWEVATLCDLAEVDRGKFTHRPRNDPAFYGGSFPFIQTGDVAAADGGVLSRASQSLNERGAGVSREFPAGTIAITIAANIADTAILGVPMYFPDSVVGAVVRERNVARFAQLCIQRAKPRLDARAPQSAQKNINLQDLRPLPLPRPSPDEQGRIAERYEALTAMLDREGAFLAKHRLLRAGLMEDLLTGRVHVASLLLSAAG